MEEFQGVTSPAVVLAETSFHLVTVAELANDSPLSALLTSGSDRTALVAALEAEAQRVLDERKAAAAKKNPLPHAERAGGCEALLGLGETVRANLVRSMHIQPGTLTLAQIEQEIAGRLKFIQPKDRPAVAARLVQWWDREIVYTLCDQRDALISRAELQQKIGAIIAEIEQDLLTPDFERAPPPDDYQPDGMLARQIHLVDGLTSDLDRAIREEWRAREQRGKWTNANPAMAATIGDYDLLLQEEWSDRHTQMTEECEGLGEVERAQVGLNLLRWSHLEAPNTTRPIAKGWDAAYYVRGSYQVLAISLKVGWHADYKAKLGGDA